jgi:hypothetical protein
MPEAFEKPRPASTSPAARRTDSYELVSVALFAGIGLLASLVIVLMRMNGLF